MTNQEIRLLARKNCKITYQAIYNYLKYVQCYSNREIRVELIEYAEWMKIQYLENSNMDEKHKSKTGNLFNNYCIEYWDGIYETLESKELLKLFRQYEARRTQDSSCDS